MRQAVLTGWGGVHASLGAAAVVIAVAVVVAGTGPERAWAQEGVAGEPTAQQRAEFNSLVARRDSLQQRLERLDEEAAARLKAGQPVTTVYARQASTQDELALVSMRLDLMSARLGLVAPEPETREQAEIELERRLREPFQQSEQRALQRVRQDTRRMLADIDYSVLFQGRSR